eukprot:m51a1_g12140 hypothetical protein (326) ;mRNA; r:469-1837
MSTKNEKLAIAGAAAGVCCCIVVVLAVVVPLRIIQWNKEHSLPCSYTATIRTTITVGILHEHVTQYFSRVYTDGYNTTIVQLDKDQHNAGSRSIQAGDTLYLEETFFKRRACSLLWSEQRKGRQCITLSRESKKTCGRCLCPGDSWSNRESENRWKRKCDYWLVGDVTVVADSRTQDLVQHSVFDTALFRSVTVDFLTFSRGVDSSAFDWTNRSDECTDMRWVGRPRGTAEAINSNTPMLEDRLCIARNETFPLSPLHSLSCCARQMGCMGGYSSKLWEDFVTEGTVTDTCVPTRTTVDDTQCNDVCDNGSPKSKIHAASSVSVL